MGGDGKRYVVTSTEFRSRYVTVGCCNKGVVEMSEGIGGSGRRDRRVGVSRSSCIVSGANALINLFCGILGFMASCVM